MEASVREFVTENPDADYRTIVERFGTPERIAEGCVAQLEPAEVLAGMQIRQRVLCLIAVVASAVLALWIVFLTVSFLDFHKDMRGYAVVEVIEIERETFAEGE